MNEPMSTSWEESVRKTAVTFPYPPTPDIASGVAARLASRRRAPRRALAWALALLLLLLLSLFSVPRVRAAIVDMFRLGAITIFVRPEAAPVSAPTATLPPLSDRILQAMTPVTLAEANAQLADPVRLPGYPAGLGPPDDVYLSLDTAVFLWRDPEQPETVQFSLYQIEATSFALKAVTVLQTTRVNGQEAAWVEGPHLFRLADGRYENWWFVPGNVLIWEEDGVTYRLEGATNLDEAIRIAESLVVWEK